jgi:hypothetical protein
MWRKDKAMRRRNASFGLIAATRLARRTHAFQTTGNFFDLNCFPYLIVRDPKAASVSTIY